MENEKKKNNDMKKTQTYKTQSNKKTKSNKKVKKHRKFWKIFRRILLVVFLLLLIVAGIAFGKIYTMFKESKLDIASLNIKYENSVVKDDDGELIAVLSGEENRDNITLSEMSQYLPKAFVAIEDERFYDHSGVDIKRTAGATAKYALSKIGIGSSSYGGSTITQQLVKNSTKEDERSWERKVKEIARAYYIEQELSKEQILELYLNLIFLGGNTYGVEVASNYYFSKSTADLSLAECAFLAGINNSPNNYDPFDEENIEKVNNRVKTVLAKMKELGPEHKAGITEEEYNTAIAEVEAGLAFKKGKIAQNNYSYHTEAAMNQVINELMEIHPDWNRDYTTLYVKSSGLTIYTTQKTDIQEIMESEFAETKYQVKSRKTKDEDGNYVTSQAAMVMIDHTTGKVVATVGGLGEKTAFGLNRATQSTRQTGSSMKPLAVLVPGIDTKTITAGTVYDDVITSFGSYHVYNSTGYRGLTTIRYAIETSQNIPMVAALRDIGVDTSIEYLKKMGISTLSEKDEYLGLSLGGVTKGVSPLEMAAAYATIANDGVYIEPTFYTKVEDSEGNIILESEQDSRTVMSKESAYVVKEILTQPAKSGTATYCSISNISVAAKTGTTDDNYDRWLCGFTPYYTASCWFGYDINETVRWSGYNPAGLLWAGVMKETHKGLESKYFSSSRPDGVVAAKICKCSGMLVTELCEEDERGNQTYTEYFVKGTVPREECTCHVSYEICKETKLIANENCTEKETKIYITRPDWETNTAWKKVKDAKYMFTELEVCTKHKAPEVIEEPEEPIVPEEPTQEPENNNQNQVPGNEVVDGNNNNVVTSPEESEGDNSGEEGKPEDSTQTSTPTTNTTPTPTPTPMPES